MLAARVGAPAVPVRAAVCGGLAARAISYYKHGENDKNDFININKVFGPDSPIRAQQEMVFRTGQVPRSPVDAPNGYWLHRSPAEDGKFKWIDFRTPSFYLREEPVDVNMQPHISAEFYAHILRFLGRRELFQPNVPIPVDLKIKREDWELKMTNPALTALEDRDNKKVHQLEMKHRQDPKPRHKWTGESLLYREGSVCIDVATGSGQIPWIMQHFFDKVYGLTDNPPTLDTAFNMIEKNNPNLYLGNQTKKVKRTVKKRSIGVRDAQAPSAERFEEVVSVTNELVLEKSYGPHDNCFGLSKFPDEFADVVTANVLPMYSTLGFDPLLNEPEMSLSVLAREANRVLKNGGVLAAYQIGLPKFGHNIKRGHSYWFRGNLRLKQYLLETIGADMVPPPMEEHMFKPFFRDAEIINIELEHQLPLSKFVETLDATYAFRRYKAANPHKPDPCRMVENIMLHFTNALDSRSTIRGIWPMQLVLFNRHKHLWNELPESSKTSRVLLDGSRSVFVPERDLVVNKS
eukprot:gnl/Spiro4/6482_TR3331_c0_g1_i1.p1 gnl/Spiro4/6482_TR3331_c0_g1~~gnl/Spiro4/6482_TR3331_c0_g1_i1.p1  ORF type:complete len:519 (-),score=96.96 gnl/Spiro4/6482_TR3331_c0_g1_i1:63-1619(-)